MHQFSMSRFTLARCLLLYAVLFSALTFPYWGQGKVISANHQLIEVGLTELPGANKSRLYGDFIESFIPALTEHLKGPRSGWLALWTNQNELGHPLIHMAGFSPAYLPSFIIAQFTTNPWRFITIFSLLTCFLAGLFLILFCDEIGLSPLAGLVAGISLSSSPLLMTTLEFPMLLSAWCWSAGALWSVTRLARKPDLLSCTVLAFSAYSLLITTVPQLVVFNVYMLIFFGLYLTHRKLQSGLPEVRRFLMLTAGAVIVGAVLTLPIFLDLARIYADSSRVHTAPSFFLVSLPGIGEWPDNLRHLVINVMPEIFGNLGPAYPIKDLGLHLTPVMIFFAITGLLLTFRKSWGWWLAIGTFCLFAFNRPLYVFAVKYLGFGLDRSNPLHCIMLPLTIIMAFGVDALVRRSDPGKVDRAVFIAATSLLLILIYGLALGFVDKLPIHWGTVGVMAVLIGLLLAQLRNTRPFLLIAALAVVLTVISSPLMFHQYLRDIATTSPLIEKMRANMPEGSRFAFVDHGQYALTPDFNAELGLPSVHSYNSLSPRRYQALIQSLGGKVIGQGRRSTVISPDYDSAPFWMSNISLILSPSMLTNKDLVYLGEESDIFMYKVASRMGDSIQVTVPETSVKGDNVQIADPRLLPVHTPTKVLDEGDRREYEVTPGAASVLVLSQTYYRDWQASVSGQSGWIPAKTVLVDGVFQGILLPPNVQRVRLDFRPFVRYAWIGHLFWLLMIVVVIWRVGRGMWSRAPGID